ncbi:MAG: GTPase HflX, partial [Deltaproteobacteria bacterium]|nr:GTPase HflX [Deltaproteobacteria bacterium]
MSYKQRLLKNRPFDTEKALLVGIRRPTDTVFEFQDSLEELRSLAYTAGANVAGVVSQEVKRIEPSTYLGKGKVEEIKNLVKELCCNVVLIDQDLSASQNRNLEKELKVKVVDRTGLILDIFSQRARTREGKLQVELAHCLYLQPRLVGQWEHFSRQTGGIRTRGPGETQLEHDQRRMRDREDHNKRYQETVQT